MRNKKIRFTTAILAALLMLSGFGSICAKADLIYEPYDNEFYTNHYQECTIDDHLYEINAEGGVRMYISPESDEVIAVFNKVGSLIQGSVRYVDRNGQAWVCGIAIDEESIQGSGSYLEGWIPADYLWRKFDAELFAQANADRIKNEIGKIDKAFDGHEYYFYRYPGGEMQHKTGTFDEGTREAPGYSRVYTDENGRKWGYVGYYYGKCDWICIDHPDQSFEQLYPNGAPERDLRERSVAVIREDDVKTDTDTEQSETESKPEMIKNGKTAPQASTTVKEQESVSRIKPDQAPRSRALIITACSVGGVVLLAVLLIVLLKRKNRQG